MHCAPFDVGRTPDSLQGGITTELKSFSVAADEFLDAALGGLGIEGPATTPFRHGVRQLMHSWGHLPIDQGANEVSGGYCAANDGAPFELSLSWQQRKVEVRFGCEPVCETPDLLARQASGLALTHRLASLVGTGAVERFTRIEDLFTSACPCKPFVLGHVVAWKAGTRPSFTMYLNPTVQGRERSAAIVAQATQRLGIARAWSSVSDRLHRYGLDDEIKVFALDLYDSRDARIKIYVNLPGRSPSDVEDIARLSPSYLPGKAIGAFSSIYRSTEPVSAKACMACLAFTSSVETLASANLYLPLDPNLPTDAEALTAVSRLMRREGIDPSSHQAMIEGLNPGPLNDSNMQSWVSCQVAGRPRVTVYVGPELYRGQSRLSARPRLADGAC